MRDIFSVLRDYRLFGNDDEGSGGGGSDKTYDSLADAAKDGQHGKAVNIKGKGRQKVEFADKSYDKRMATVSANAGGGGGGTVAKAAKTVSEFGGRGPDGRYEPIPGPRTIAQRIRGSFDGTDSLHRPASNFKTINNSQRRALEAAGYSVTKQGTVKSRDGSATVAGSRWSRSPQVNQIMAENADDRASVRSGGDRVPVKQPVVPKKIVRPQLRPADLPKPTTAPLDYDTLYTGDPGMTGDPGIFTSPYQVGPRPSTYSPSSFPGGGDPMLADPPRGTPSMGTSFGSFGNPVDMSRDVPLSDQRRPLVADPYLSDVLADERLGTYDDLKDSQRMAAEQQLNRDSLTPSISDILREQQIQREVDPSKNQGRPPGSYDSAGLGNLFENLFSSDEGVASSPVRVGRQDGPGTIANAVPGILTDADVEAYKRGFGPLDPNTGLRMKVGAAPLRNLTALEAGLAGLPETVARAGDVALDYGTGLFRTIGYRGGGLGVGSADVDSDVTMAQAMAPQTDLQKAYTEKVVNPAIANSQAAYDRLSDEAKAKLEGELSFDNVGTKFANMAPSIAVSTAAAVASLPAAIVAGVTLGVGGMDAQIEGAIQKEFDEGRLQNTPGFQDLKATGLSDAEAVLAYAGGISKQAAPIVASISAAGGSLSNAVLNGAVTRPLAKAISQKAAVQGATQAGRRGIVGPTVEAASRMAIEGLTEGMQEIAEAEIPSWYNDAQALKQTSAQRKESGILGFLGGTSGSGVVSAAQGLGLGPQSRVGPTVEAAADIETVGTDPTLTQQRNIPPDPFASPNQLADQLAAKAAQQQQATPKPTSDAAASVISGAPKGDPNVLANQLARERAEAELKAKTLATPPPVVPGIAIAPEVLALSPPTGQVPSVRSPVEFANLQNQRGFDPSQVDTSGAQAAAITPDDIGTDPIDMEGADAAARERLASELLQSGTIPNPNALADQLAAQAARNAATADGLETAPVEAAAQGTLPGLDIDDGSNPQSIGAARVDDTTRLIDENAQLAEILQRGETEAAALDDGLALDTLDLSGKMFTGGVPTNFETTGLSRFSPLADQIYTTSQRADMQRANQLDMALRARRLAEEAAQKPQNIAQAALDALDQGGPDKSAVEQVNEAREATKLYREYIDTKNQTEALNRAMRSGIGSVFNPDGSVQPTTPSPAAEVTAPEAVSTSGIVPPVDAAAVADQIVGSSEAGLDAGLSEDAAMAEIMRNFDTNIPLTETVEQRVARQLESQRRRQEGQIPDRNFLTDLPRPGTDTPAQQLARRQRQAERLQRLQRNFPTDLPLPGTDTASMQRDRQRAAAMRRKAALEAEGIGSLATVPPKETPLEGEVLDDLGPFVGGRGEVPGETIEGVAVDLNQVPSPMGRADMDPFLYEGEVIDPEQTTDLTEAKAPVVDTIEGTINRPKPTVEELAQGIGSLTAAEDAARARITPPTAEVESKKVRRAPLVPGGPIDAEVQLRDDGTPYFPELPTDDVLPPEEREGGPSGPSDDRPAVVPVDMTDDSNDAQGCPPGYRRVLDPATGRYICLKIEEGSAGVPAAPAEEEEEEDGVVIDIPVTERPKISPYYVPEMIESNYTPYVPGRRARIFKDVAVE